jgi:hypothetical protein
VLERSACVGRRFHDDFQGLENWSTSEDAHEELRRLGIDTDWWHRAFRVGHLHDRQLRRTEVRSTQPLFYCVRRGAGHSGSLDNALLRQALAAGVDVRFGQKVEPSEVRIYAGGPTGRPTAVARGVTFALDHEDLACQVLSDALAPKGYVYFVVADGQATLGVVLLHAHHEAAARLDAAIESLQRLYRFQVPESAVRWGGHASFSLPRSAVLGETLVAGEAAGFQDALFGFGIRTALLSGALAADAVATGGCYDSAWRQHLLPRMQASAVNRTLFEHAGFAGQALWHAMRLAPDGRSLLRRLYAHGAWHRVVSLVVHRMEDGHRKIVSPP